MIIVSTGTKRVKKRANTDSSLSAKKKRHRMKKELNSQQLSKGNVRAQSFDLGG